MPCSWSSGAGYSQGVHRVRGGLQSSGECWCVKQLSSRGTVRPSRNSEMENLSVSKEQRRREYTMYFAPRGGRWGTHRMPEGLQNSEMCWCVRQLSDEATRPQQEK